MNDDELRNYFDKCFDELGGLIDRFLSGDIAYTYVSHELTYVQGQLDIMLKGDIIPLEDHLDYLTKIGNYIDMIFHGGDR